MTSSPISIRALAPNLADFGERFGRWWLRECLSLIPQRFASWLLGERERTLIIAESDDAILLSLSGAHSVPLATVQIPRLSFSPAAIEDFLSQHKVARAEVIAGLRIGQDKCFRRKLILPIEAKGSLKDVAALDLAKKTPFRADDIFHGETVVETDGSKQITVWQHIVRRDLVHQANASLGIAPKELTFIEIEQTESEGTPARIILRDPDSKSIAWIRRTLIILSVSAAILAMTAATLKYLNQKSTLESLTSEVRTARAKAQQARSALEKLEHKQASLLHIRSKKAVAPGFLDVWHEVTRVLPKHSWITELRMAEVPGKQDTRIILSGFSEAAASLIGLIDHSPLFSETSFTAAVSFDPTEERERFGLQANLAKKNQAEKASQ